jgi:hypothetical protein
MMHGTEAEDAAAVVDLVCGALSLEARGERKAARLLHGQSGA